MSKKKRYKKKDRWRLKQWQERQRIKKDPEKFEKQRQLRVEQFLKNNPDYRV